MLTVRFPSGVAVHYNTATYCVRGENGWQLYTEKDGCWVATIQASAGAIVEAVPACSVTVPPVATVKSALQLIVHELARNPITGWEEGNVLSELKRRLASYNARTKTWRR